MTAFTKEVGGIHKDGIKQKGLVSFYSTY